MSPALAGEFSTTEPPGRSGTTGQLHIKCESRHRSYILHNNKFKMDQRHMCKSKTTKQKITQEKNWHEFMFSNDILDRTPKTQSIELITDKLDFIKITSSELLEGQWKL